MNSLVSYFIVDIVLFGPSYSQSPSLDMEFVDLFFLTNSFANKSFFGDFQSLDLFVVINTAALVENWS